MSDFLSTLNKGQASKPPIINTNIQSNPNGHLTIGGPIT
jgi:hypothetical protein